MTVSYSVMFMYSCESTFVVWINEVHFEKHDYIGAIVTPNISRHLKHAMRVRAGDNEVHFADKIMKINRGNEMRKRLLVITGSNFYILDPASFRCKRQIPLETINALCLSELNDNFFAIIVASGNDMLLASSRKTEIVTVLHTALKSLRLDLNVEFTNR